ncbi:MAG: phosphotransferase [Sphingomonas sp.]
MTRLTALMPGIMLDTSPQSIASAGKSDIMNASAPPRLNAPDAGGPTPIWLQPSDETAIAHALRRLGWLADDATLTGVSRAGDGNLNIVLRVESGSRTAILKQARPWVEKYPEISAPVGRSLVEVAYYRLVHAVPELSALSPALLGSDPTWYTLLLEDLGDAGDATSLYAGDTLSAADLDRLMTYLVALHGLSDRATRMPDNAAMLALNHHYIFEQPFSPDGDDADLAGIAAALGKRYLSGAGVPLHGDYFPGAWVKSNRGLYIIDPEFCLIGPPEFDLGVMAAHLLMAGGPASTTQTLAAQYGESGGGVLDTALLARFTGVEIWRRLRGVAQLPLSLDDVARDALLDIARMMLRA